MERIIKGKRYNTETAKVVAVWTPEDGENRSETLYKKNTGEYFLLIAVECAWESSEKIRPLAYEVAKSWGQAKMPEPEYKKEFVSIDSEGEDRLCVRLSTKSREHFERYISQTGEKKGTVIERLIMSLKVE